jgi:hypothetical protein
MNATETKEGATRMNVRGWNGLTIKALVLVGAVASASLAAEPIVIDGMAFGASNSSEHKSRKKRLDHHHVTRAKKPMPPGTPAEVKKGLRRPMKGWSGGDSWWIGFPTADTFVLHTGGQNVATGSVGRRNNTVTLEFDEASKMAFLRWVEDDLERFWNAGVLDLRLKLDLSRLADVQARLKLRRNEKTGELGGSFMYRVKYEGTIESVIGYRGLGLSVVGTGRQKSDIRWSDEYFDFEDPYWF